MAKGPQAQQLSGPVHVTIPASVAYDLTALQKSIANLVERLGCAPCFSGADCSFHMERDYIINEKLDVVPVPTSGHLPAGMERMGLSTSPSIVAGIGTSPTNPATVTINSAVFNDLSKVQATVAKTMARLGCLGCCSGFDILFRRERELLINEAGEIGTL